ncbi:4-hydroxythreonine-4-phosphate dehydrogenase PdxA [Polymorphobacter fuscus]|uniref:4-hydroxythreonine-4-phosphate dehydrogenase n=1 Tax=Sandarakinorhabdus fusca TaxID=1439888 RepID=A0A7C9KLF2_9SPHN|nr:4-hydroxythreonine-4-phosphate dehydrogenase PdxA [Polymorphobacter fuscus]KAB7648721.1 4-hydroxythreonine-4-phosphate dehydrogenase PdxA [Polymorphobacter fuscus]MQT16284.1 4-hydroxythreonine-4-phosphate dehydrogenase PdxA [Polymorphobacter fuscus]NJC07431.1 4-hydroxythreonine-4-phosphate dehydrogenase [Polymorphobacter fuscus]
MDIFPTPAPLAVSIGDPAGIGPEIVAAAWAARRSERLPAFFAIGDRRALEAVWDGPIITLGAPGEAAAAFDDGLPLVQVDDPGEIIPGDPNLAGARCALDSLEIAVGLARNGFAGGIVTGPVSKAQLYAIGFNYPGQTEFVAERCGISASNAVMMLAGPTLRTVPITVHLPLADVPRLLTVDLIVAKSRITARALMRDYGIERPRLAFAGLNPHAGESGTLGREEAEIIRPAVEALQAEDINVHGPLAADSMFHAPARRHYDAAMCMYHDQALIPLKTLHFDDGVNVTLGLPIVRTSPDHGTAFGIAGKGLANPRAMIEAIRMAGQCAARRLTSG